MMRHLLGSFALGGLLSFAFGACGDDTAATTCNPGDEVFCDCPVVEEGGTKTCLDDGESYGPCVSPEGECTEVLGCGDGFFDPDLGEECDDGNFDDFDG